MDSIEKLEKRLLEITEEIKEVKKRLPAHSVKPPVMMDLLDLEDEYDRVRKRIKLLRANK